MNVQRLNELWKQKWPERLSITDGLEKMYGDKWVRFYNLPEAKRYPENNNEFTELLGRQNTLLSDLTAHAGNRLYVIVSEWTNTESETPDWPIDIKSIGELTYWQTIDEDSEEMDAEFKSYRQLYITNHDWTPGSIDTLLKLVADDKVAGVIIMPEDGTWLYQPYDGGMDVILESPEDREKLVLKHSDWM